MSFLGYLHDVRAVIVDHEAETEAMQQLYCIVQLFKNNVFSVQLIMKLLY